MNVFFFVFFLDRDHPVGNFVRGSLALKKPPVGNKKRKGKKPPKRVRPTVSLEEVEEMFPPADVEEEMHRPCSPPYMP